MAFQISATKLLTYQQCPWKYFLRYCARVSVPKGIDAVLGLAEHQLIAYFHSLKPSTQAKRLKDGLTLLRPMTEDSAIGYWRRYCADLLKEEQAQFTKHKDKIRFRGQTPKEIKKEKSNAFGQGTDNIGKYWRDNNNAPPLVAVEDRFSNIPAPGRSDVVLEGSLDQIREIPYKDGKTGNQYITDLKRSWQDYGIMVPRIQYPVHNDYQFTIYSWAYRMKYRRKEAGIIRYPLGYKGKCPITGNKIDKKALVTPRTNEHYLELARLINFFITCLEKELFPRFYGAQCSKFCDYTEVCGAPKLVATEPLAVSQIDWGKMEIETIIQQLEEAQELQKFSQPRLKLRPKQ